MREVKWTPDDDGIQLGGTVGGDGAGEAVSIRYHSEQVPNAWITSYYFVVDKRERWSDCDDDPRPFSVEEVVEYYAHEPGDPDAETWCDYEYGEGSVFAYETEAEAEAERDRMARIELSWGGEWYGWNGEPA